MSDTYHHDQNVPPTLVNIDKVVKSFGDKTALEQLSWTLPKGQISGLLGPNGAGKTTLFRLLMGILKPTSGSLTVDGLDCFNDGVAVKRLVGFLPDEPVFYSYLSGREILELSAGMHDLDTKLVFERLEGLIERLNMRDALDAFAEDYSRGMKKKLGLLLAVLHEPTLLILDEPTNGLDVESTQLFFELMREKMDTGTTVVFSTHLMSHVEQLCSHIAIISEGKLVTSGTLDTIRKGRSLEEAYLELTRRTTSS